MAIPRSFFTKRGSRRPRGCVWSWDMSPAEALAQLSDEEARALHGAAAWYARYHVLDIAAEAGDRSGAATKDRERFLALVRALERLGTPMPLPEELRPALRKAA